VREPDEGSGNRNAEDRDEEHDEHSHKLTGRAGPCDE
jgi:hypothetical protein